MNVSDLIRMAIEEEEKREVEESNSSTDTGTNNQEEESALLGDGIEETAVDKAAANADGKTETDRLRDGVVGDDIIVDASEKPSNKADSHEDLNAIYEMTEDRNSADESAESKSSSWKHRLCVSVCFLVLVPAAVCLVVLIFNNVKGTPRQHKFTFTEYYHDHMVLQSSPHSAVIWGYVPYDSIDHNITLTLISANTKRQYTAELTSRVKALGGIWRVILDPVSDFGPFNISVDLNGSASIQLHDVLFGDVWLCAGGRSMKTSLKKLEKSEVDAAVDRLEDYSQVRVMALKSGEASYHQDEIHPPTMHWSRPDRALLKRSDFSAACWLYGRRLHDRVRQPIGLISAAYYPSSITDWMPPSVRDRCEMLVPYQTSTVFKMMIHPLLNTALRGIIWYQGEFDAERSLSYEAFTRPKFHYDCILVHTINDWRAAWANGTGGVLVNPEPAVGIVQESPCRNNSIDDVILNSTMDDIHGFTHLRYEQTSNYGLLPNQKIRKSFLATTVDLLRYRKRKCTVDYSALADRLVHGALTEVYERSVTVPPLPSHYLLDPSTQTLVLRFSSHTLQQRSSLGFEVCCADSVNSRCPPYYVKTVYAGGREWVALRSLDLSNNGQLVTLSWRGDDVSACRGRHVTAVRYLWRDTACRYLKCPLYDAVSALPMPPYIIQALVADSTYHRVERAPLAVAPVNGF